MSYDIYLCDHVTHKPLKADSAHFIAGGMRAMGGTKELWLNITYNYGHFYYRPEVFGEGRHPFHLWKDRCREHPDA